MMDYDFKILQPSEFECLSRDLLQAREGIFIESFADGRDKGIDFRFAYSEDKTCIIQCKRYKEWNELNNHLKKEVAKVEKLKPQRYILTTSVDLSMEQKEKILEMFSPYIVNASDILGRKDLNNLLDKHKEIEKDYHKLWLASTNVLNLILHREIVNWSALELEKIQHDVSLYVENESLSNALDVLQKNHYVIISGIPGIGKTTLARMLVYTMLAREMEEFVYITDDLNNAVKLFDKEKSQIFFYDDFLGSNSFAPKQDGFENKLVSFIEKIKKSENKLFILATREYVLSEAKTYYEKLSMNNIDLAKCTIEMEYYTKPIKAKILYNHLAEADIPADYIDAFLEEHSYREIIGHRNFNPRVIEAIINDKIWNSVAPKDFASKIKEFFDYPIKVWEYAFEKMDVATRYALLVLGTMGNRVLLEDYQEAYKTFCKLTYDDVGLLYDDVKWRQSLRVLTNCFIKIESTKGKKTVSMYNPSIADFIVYHLSQSQNTVNQLIIGARFVEQLYYLYSDNQEQARRKKNVFVSEGSFHLINDSFNRIWSECKSCKLKDVYWNDTEKEGFRESRILFDFTNKFTTFCKQHEGFVEKMYDTKELTCGSINLRYRTGMMRRIDWEKMSTKVDEYLIKIVEAETLYSGEWIDIVDVINELGVRDEVIDDYFYSKLDDDLDEEIGTFSELSDCDDEYNKINTLRELLPGWRWYHVFDTVSYMETQIKERDEENDSSSENNISYDSWYKKEEKEDKEIDEMFSALRI